MLDRLCLSLPGGDSCSCLCMNTLENEEEFEKNPLVGGSEYKSQLLRLKDVVDGKQTLAFQLKPKTVVLRVCMHCHGCARKVEKHISKIEGVISYKVDLETKKVVVIGDILTFEVLESVSKVISLLLPTIAPIWMEVFLISKIMNHPKSSTVLRISDAALL